jgi:uncharacterized OB-fold protein
MRALKPELYTIPASGETPALCGGTCACGYVFFPMQRYGCEKCGKTGDALTPTLLEGEGTLVASSRVLMHARKDRQAPFVVLSVKLKGGPVVRTLLAEDTDKFLPAGLRLKACLVEVDGPGDGEKRLDLRFAPAA